MGWGNQWYKIWRNVSNDYMRQTERCILISVSRKAEVQLSLFYLENCCTWFLNSLDLRSSHVSWIWSFLVWEIRWFGGTVREDEGQYFIQLSFSCSARVNRYFSEPCSCMFYTSFRANIAPGSSFFNSHWLSRTFKLTINQIRKVNFADKIWKRYCSSYTPSFKRSLRVHSP